LENNANRKSSAIIILLLFLVSISLKAYDRNALYPFKNDSSLYEINKIIFNGNNSFSDEELFFIISSKPSNINFVHKILDYYYIEGKENKFTPKTIIKSLEISLKDFESEYKFLNIEKVKLDSSSISNFYMRNGFHLVDVKYDIYADSINRENIIEFFIEENDRFNLSGFHIKGIDDLDDQTLSKIDSYLKKNKKKYFSEDEVIFQLNGISNILLNNGYFFSRKIDEKILVDREKLVDSVEVEYYLGGRYRFGKINFVDVKGDQRKVTDNQKKALLDWEVGDYYSKAKIERSIRNLISLGTFNSVTIDTTNFRDSIIDYAIITNYRNQQEIFFEPGVNQTQNNFYNVFTKASYSHRNRFGEGQILYTSLSILNRDFEDYLKTKNQGFLNYLDDFIDEYSININYTDPYIWKVYDAYMGLNFAPSFSIRRIDNFFDLYTTLIPVNLPIKLKTDLDFTNVSIYFNFEKQQPIGFDDFLNSNVDDENIDRVFQSLVLYNDLNNYFKTNNNWYDLSSIAFGGRLIRDKRNNPFIPTKGHLFNLDAEVAFAGLTNYFRLLTSFTNYTSISKSEVVGTKIKFGGVAFFDQNNRYVSLDKQFFAGGANSVRGWNSRKLRYTKEDLSDLDASSRRLLENFVGNNLVMEGSLEYRLKFKSPEINLGALNDHISSMGVTAFFDFGNAYGWLLESSQYNFADIFLKMACSAGTGLTYETPVGPLRLDIALPIYGPINNTYETIWQTEDVTKNINWHIGLGYAF